MTSSHSVYSIEIEPILDYEVGVMGNGRTLHFIELPLQIGKALAYLRTSQFGPSS